MAKEEFDAIVKLAKESVKELVDKKPLSVISITKEGDKTIALVEVLEREAVPDTQNLIGEYKLTFSAGNKLLGYNRVSVRRKCDTGSAEVSEEETK
ncbi:MAG: gas vesicle protein GvpO [Candidatus Diapherotrites archaeon]|nr:gas vesicle protein GvpO [Candidatus Diapherotrites archaeon]